MEGSPRSAPCIADICLTCKDQARCPTQQDVEGNFLAVENLTLVRHGHARLEPEQHICHAEMLMWVEQQIAALLMDARSPRDWKRCRFLLLTSYFVQANASRAAEGGQVSSWVRDGQGDIFNMSDGASIIV